MKFSRSDTERKGWEGLSFWVYNTREQFPNASAAYFEVTGSHGLTMTTASDRVYYVIEGGGEFIMGAETISVEPGDVVIVPKGIEYDYWATVGKTLKLFLVHAPAYDPDAEVKMDR